MKCEVVAVCRNLAARQMTDTASSRYSRKTRMHPTGHISQKKRKRYSISYMFGFGDFESVHFNKFLSSLIRKMVCCVKCYRSLSAQSGNMDSCLKSY